MERQFWYGLTNSTEKDIGIAYPQIASMSFGYDLRKPDSVWNIPNNKMPDFYPDLEYFVLDKRARLTDVISSGFISADGFLVNKKVKLLFETFPITKHVYFPAQVMVKMKLYDNYYWLHFTENDNSLVDFRQSSFLLTHPLPFFRTEEIILTGNSLEELLIQRKQYPDYNLFAKEIRLNNKNTIRHLYCFSFLWDRVMVSQSLKDSIEKEKIEGFSFHQSGFIS